MKNVTKRIFFIIREMIEDNKLIFILMIIGLILSDFVMIYFVGNFTSYKNSMLDGYGVFRYAAENNAGLDYNEITGLDFSEYGVKVCTFSSIVSPSDVHMSGGGIITDGYGTKGSFYICCEKNDDFPLKEYLGECDITKSDKENVIVVPATSYTEGLVYDNESKSYGTVEFYGQTLYIIGISAYVNEAVIPYKLYSEKFSPNNVAFYADRQLGSKQSDELRDKIFEIFGCSGLADPYSYYRAADRGYAALIVILFIAYLISLLSFVFYIVYFTKRRAKSNSIAYICGANQRQLIFETLITNETIAVSCLVISMILRLFVNAVPDLFYSVKYEARDYISMLLIVMTATLIASVPSVRALKKSTAAELSRNVT